MIQIANGNILASKAQALVIPVNTLGAMGKGLALQAAKTWPDLPGIYRRALRNGHLAIGKVFTVQYESVDVILFPTKADWRNPSRPEYVQTGLQSLAKELLRMQPHEVAIPALGCGLGGLSWKTVQPMIETALGELPIRVRLYIPREGG